MLDPRRAAPAAPATVGMTSRQAHVLRFITGYQQAHGVSPTYREIARALGIGGKGSVASIIYRLQARGRICRLRNRVRAIEVLAPLPIPSIDGQPLYFLPIGAAPRD